MPVFAKSLLRRIASDLAEKPLNPGEMRSIPKMAPYHVSAEPCHGDSKPLFTIELEGKPYYIYYFAG